MSSKYENLWKKVAVYLTIIKIQKLKNCYNKRAVNINLFFETPNNYYFQILKKGEDIQKTVYMTFFLSIWFAQHFLSKIF